MAENTCAVIMSDDPITLSVEDALGRGDVAGVIAS
jgi:hypothetical protein